MTGSFPIRTYLPESDLDIVIFLEKSAVEEDTILCIFNSLCRDAISPVNGYKKFQTDMHIRNIEFVNARTKLIHSVVNNINVDITINHPGAVAASAFLEEADRLIGNNHLFKRSLLLIKVNFFYIKF